MAAAPRIFVTALVSKSWMAAMESLEMVTAILPSQVKIASLTLPLCLSKDCNNVPSAFQRHDEPSLQAVKTIEPSGEKREVLMLA